MTILAHFDGKLIVPDEPIDLPVGTSLELEIRRANGVSTEVKAAMEATRDGATAARRLAAFEQFVARIDARQTGRAIPAEALRREHLYGDAGR
jgi:hypothetical protein